jgi:hypothetical protein
MLRLGRVRNESTFPAATPKLRYWEGRPERMPSQVHCERTALRAKAPAPSQLAAAASRSNVRANQFPRSVNRAELSR